MINNISLTGRLTKDPELRFTASGVAVTNFTLAVQRNMKKEDGKQDVDFLQCVAWRGLAEVMANYLKKGSLIGVQGRLQARTFTVKENEVDRTAYVTEVVVDDFCFLETKKDIAGNPDEMQQFQSNYTQKR